MSSIDQVPLPQAKTDDEQFKMLQDWLAAYQPEHIFDESTESATIIRPEVLEILPKDPHKRLGQSPYATKDPVKLKLPAEWTSLGKPVGEAMSPMRGPSFRSATETMCSVFAC